MRKSIIAAAALALAVIAQPTTVSARTDVTVGAWKVGGERGVCSGVYRAGDSLLMLISPDGGNHGGLVISNRNWAVQKTPARIALMGDGAPKGGREAYGDPDFSGYFIPFNSATEYKQFDSNWHLRAVLEGSVIVDADITDFQPAMKAMLDCARTPTN